MQKELEVTRTLELDDLKSLADTPGPCLTLYLPIEKSPNTTRLEGMRLKSVAQSAEQALRERNIDKATIKELLGPISNIADMREHWGATLGGTLVVLRSRDIFRGFEVGRRLDEAVHVGDHFQIRPVLKSLQEDKLEFYLLALSQKHVRLLRCTRYGSVEVPLPDNTPTDMETWLNTRPPHAPPGQEATRPSDAGPIGSFTSTTDVDHKDQQIANFFHVINKAVCDMLKDQTVPMVLCGVEYELSMYQSINSYGNLLPDGVQGSPESLKGGELHKRALEIAHEWAKEPMLKALAIYEKLGGSERVSTNPEEIVKSAHQSRIAFLFADEAESFNGRYDPDTMKIRDDGMIEDLVNLAALRTLTYGGEVFIAPSARIPGQGAMAAIYRF
jgi:hypothetical protein